MADDKYPRGYRNDQYDRDARDSDSATDPLTELARLIGQSDPLSSDRNRQPDRRQSARYHQSPDWHADPAQNAQQSDPQHYDPQHYDTQQQYDAQHYDPQHGAHNDRYGAADPQHYADDTQGSSD